MTHPKLESFKVALMAGPVSIEGNWKPNEAEQRAAWELYVELVTRISVMRIGDQKGLLREALTSLYTIFEVTRNILRQSGPGVTQHEEDGELSFGFIAIVILNYVLRPFLEEWHPRLQDYEDERQSQVSRFDHETAWNQNKQFREALEKVRVILIEYTTLLARVANVPTLVLEPNLSRLPTEKELVLDGDTLPFQR